MGGITDKIPGIDLIAKFDQKESGDSFKFIPISGDPITIEEDKPYGKYGDNLKDIVEHYKIKSYNHGLEWGNIDPSDHRGIGDNERVAKWDSSGGADPIYFIPK